MLMRSSDALSAQISEIVTDSVSQCIGQKNIPFTTEVETAHRHFHRSCLKPKRIHEVQSSIDHRFLFLRNIDYPIEYFLTCLVFKNDDCIIFSRHVGSFNIRKSSSQPVGHS